MCEWISVEDELPELDEWVNVLCDVGGYSEINEHGDPDYWFESDYYMYLVLKKEIITTTCATLRYIEDGWGTWQQWELASGHSLCDIKYVTHWQPRPSTIKDQAKQEATTLLHMLAWSNNFKPYCSLDKIGVGEVRDYIENVLHQEWKGCSGVEGMSQQGVSQQDTAKANVNN